MNRADDAGTSPNHNSNSASESSSEPRAPDRIPTSSSLSEEVEAVLRIRPKEEGIEPSTPSPSDLWNTALNGILEENRAEGASTHSIEAMPEGLSEEADELLAMRQQIEEQRDHITACQDQIIRLKENHSKQRDELTSLRQIKREQGRKLALLENEKEDKRTFIIRQHWLHKQAISRIWRLENRLARKQNQLTQAKEQTKRSQEHSTSMLDASTSTADALPSTTDASTCMIDFSGGTRDASTSTEEDSSIQTSSLDDEVLVTTGVQNKFQHLNCLLEQQETKIEHSKTKLKEQKIKHLNQEAKSARELEEAKKQVKELRVEAETERSDIQRQYESAREETSRLQDEVKENEIRIATLSSDISRKDDRRQDLDKKLSEDFRRYEERITTLNRNCSHLETAKRKLDTKVYELSEHNRSLQRDVEQGAARLQSSISQADTNLRHEKEAARSEIERHERTIRELEGTLEERDRTILTLQVKCQEKRDEQHAAWEAEKIAVVQHSETLKRSLTEKDDLLRSYQSWHQNFPRSMQPGGESQLRSQRQSQPSPGANGQHFPTMNSTQDARHQQWVGSQAQSTRNETSAGTSESSSQLPPRRHINPQSQIPFPQSRQQIPLEPGFVYTSAYGSRYPAQAGYFGPPTSMPTPTTNAGVGIASRPQGPPLAPFRWLPSHALSYAKYPLAFDANCKPVPLPSQGHFKPPTPPDSVETSPTVQQAAAETQATTGRHPPQIENIHE